MAEEQYPIFKSEGGAFDRAKVESDIAKSGGASVTQEIGDAMKESNQASKEAIDFYTKIFKDEIKALDSAYDPNSVYYNYAYSPASADRRKIQRTIENGEAIDGKEIVPIAKESAASKVRNAAILKTGTVTQIVESVGIKNIKGDMEAFEDVKKDFDSKIQNEEFKFEKLLDKFTDILGFFGSAQSGQQQTLFTPENNAVISALAKILSQEGFESQSVKEMTSRYEDNLTSLVSKSSEEGKLETAVESKINESEKKAELLNTEQRVEEKKAETPTQAEQNPMSEVKGEIAVSPQEKGIETATTGEQKTQPVVDQRSGAQSIEATTQLSALETAKENKTAASEEQGTNNLKEPGKSAQSKSGSSFLDEFFGGLFSSEKKEPTLKEDLIKLTGEMSSSGESKELTKNLTTGIESSSEVSKSTGSLSSSLAVGKSTPAGMAKSVEKIQEKIGASPETFSKPEGIKETVTQKLGSRLKDEKSSTEAERQQSLNSVQESTQPQAKTESQISSASEKTQELTKETSQVSMASESKTDKGNEDLSKKMETMIFLLSQLNDTLSGPLMVTPTTKKFE